MMARRNCNGRLSRLSRLSRLVVSIAIRSLTPQSDQLVERKQDGTRSGVGSRPWLATTTTLTNFCSEELIYDAQRKRNNAEQKMKFVVYHRIFTNNERQKSNSMSRSLAHSPLNT